MTNQMTSSFAVKPDCIHTSSVHMIGCLWKLVYYCCSQECIFVKVGIWHLLA